MVLLQGPIVALECQEPFAQQQAGFAIVGLTLNDSLERLYGLTWLLQSQVSRAEKQPRRHMSGLQSQDFLKLFDCFPLVTRHVQRHP